MSACIDCGEEADRERCRDCDIEHLLNRMKCQKCGRMKHTRPESFPELGTLAVTIWGEPCACPKATP